MFIPRTGQCVRSAELVAPLRQEGLGGGQAGGHHGGGGGEEQSQIIFHKVKPISET